MIRMVNVIADGLGCSSMESHMQVIESVAPVNTWVVTLASCSDGSPLTSFAV